ncbi:hypothetical protein TNCV_926341 [Trichonephila clavipes]|nr:hypothetical protein TNCV_926341 [Trichonephila clavipes]
MQVRTSAYADSIIPSNQLFCIDLSQTNAGLFRVPLSLHTRTVVKLKKQHLNMLLPISMSKAHLLRRTVAWGQRNEDHWPTCIEPSLMKPITYKILLPRATVFARSILCSVSTGC